jgi:hypothetical protein
MLAAQARHVNEKGAGKRLSMPKTAGKSNLPKARAYASAGPIR